MPLNEQLGLGVFGSGHGICVIDFRRWISAMDVSGNPYGQASAMEQEGDMTSRGERSCMLVEQIPRAFLSPSFVAGTLYVLQVKHPSLNGVNGLKLNQP